MDDREAARLAKVLSNPIRLRFVHTLHARGRQGTLARGGFSRETGVELHNLEIHIKVLRESGLLEIAEMIQRRGAMEHLYALGGPHASAAGALGGLLANGQEDGVDYRAAAKTMSAFAHPLRIAYLRAMSRGGREGKLSSAEFVRESGAEPYSVNYHLGGLRRAGVIELAELVPQRGAPERWYSISGPREKALVDLLVRT
jgi:DNA-binding transcriptional ArsR family regulator